MAGRARRLGQTLGAGAEAVVFQARVVILHPLLLRSEAGRGWPGVAESGPIGVIGGATLRAGCY